MLSEKLPRNENICLSVVVPVYNEEGAIAELHREIVDACTNIGQPFEIIFINDGSTDRTLDVLKSLSPLKIINFRKNFGQTSAIDAGIKNSVGKYIVTLDGDGQNDPNDIAKLLKKLEDDDLDIVSGWRRKRKDTFSKKIASKMAAFVRRKMVNDGIHDSGCSLKIYKHECFENTDLFGEMHRFIPALLTIKGFTVGEIEVNHRPRTTGITKYNWKRGIKGNLDIFSVWFWKKFASRPLHFFGTIGLLLVLFSFVCGLVLIYDYIFKNADISGTALTPITLFAFLSGSQFLVFGLIGDMLSKLYYSRTNDTPYTIKEIIDNKE